MDATVTIRTGIVARRARLRWLLPVVSTLVIYLLVYVAAWQFFQVRIVPRRALWDFALQLAFAYALFALSRRVWPFLMLQAVVMAALYLGSAAKIAVLARPVMPEDVDAIGALFGILGPAGWLLVALPLALMIGLLLGNLRLRGLAPAIGGGGLALVIALFLLMPAPLSKALDKRFGNTEWDQRENYIWRGAGLHLVQETARLLAHRQPPPGRAEALAIADRRLAGPREVSLRLGGVPRNIYVLLQESFWDPSALANAGFTAPPLDPRFVELWRQTGYSQALSPAFGGQTANAEFEFLCGFPVRENAVLFERGFRNDLPCLPRLLANFGYWTVASHPNVAGFWNRTNAYGHAGFETYWSAKDFELDDLNGPFLSDRSLYRQVGTKLAAGQDERPIFNYILTFYGHWAYDMSPTRPQIIESSSAVSEVDNYANVVHWKSAELMDEIERLRAEDPDSIIIVFGDHLPSLGANFAGYVESGLFAKRFADFTPAMYQASVGTPLVVIDGRRGPLQLGRRPMFELPRLVLDLIGYDRLTMFDLATPPGDMMIRPLPGATLSFIDNQIDLVCYKDSTAPDCRRAEEWLADVDVLARDLFTGDAHALTALHVPDGSLPLLPQPGEKPPYIEVELEAAPRDHEAGRIAEHGAMPPSLQP